MLYNPVELGRPAECTRSWGPLPHTGLAAPARQPQQSLALTQYFAPRWPSGRVAARRLRGFEFGDACLEFTNARVLAGLA